MGLKEGVCFNLMLYQIFCYRTLQKVGAEKRSWPKILVFPGDSMKNGRCSAVGFNY